MNENKVILMNILGGMNAYIENLEDEELTELWQMSGVPDGATEEDLAEIADDLDLVKDILMSFVRRLTNQQEKN